MERRHQVFISSTFVDLVDERREVIEALLEMDAIPAGMELFAAGDTDQWTLIQQVIDQSDYYIVIVGGRYGSMTAEGISYTEKEYDYALGQGIPVMGFVHRDPDSIVKGKSEMDPEASRKLDAFREKVQQKITRDYSTPSELGGVVSRGLHKLQKDAPRPGWVRGDLAMTPETEARISEMRAELAELKQAASERKAESAGPAKIDGLASGADTYGLTMKITGNDKQDSNQKSYNRKSYLWSIDYQTSWNGILETIGPSLMDEASEYEIAEALDALGKRLIRQQPARMLNNIDVITKAEIAPSSVDDVLVQLFALGLTARGMKKRTMSDHNRYWGLTSAGQDQVMLLRAIRRPTADELKEERREELAYKTVPELRTLAKKLALDGKGLKLDLIEAIVDAERAKA
jgi:hypothetical protein